MASRRPNRIRGRSDPEALEPLLQRDGAQAQYTAAAASSSLLLAQSPPSQLSAQVHFTSPSQQGGPHAPFSPQPLPPLTPQVPTLQPPPIMAQSASAPGKSQQLRMPKRTTKTSQKLTLFPEGIPDEVDVDTLDVAADDRDAAAAQPQLPHVTAKAQKERWLTKIERKWLPRVTAYCTANAYKMNELLEHLRKQSPRHHTQPKRFDEVIYTSFYFPPVESNIAVGSKRNVGGLAVRFGPDVAGGSISAPPSAALSDHSPLPSQIDSISRRDGFGAPNSVLPVPDIEKTPSNVVAATASANIMQHAFSDADSFFEQNIDATGKSIPRDIHNESLAKQIAPVGEVLYFDYGVVVMWGLTELEERAILLDLENFEEERLAPDSVETEQFYFHYHTMYQPRIYNDIITLRNPANYMLKITISHAIAQSVKLALFEGLIEETIENTKHVPQVMAIEGKINMSRKAINQKIGQLFIMRINVNLVSNVLDTPEIFWSEPALEPLYRAVRGYLEISQRVELLNQRVSVISDLLDMLKEHLNSSHGEQLEWIVIILIGFEIFIGIITITVDLTASYHRT